MLSRKNEACQVLEGWRFQREAVMQTPSYCCGDICWSSTSWACSVGVCSYFERTLQQQSYTNGSPVATWDLSSPQKTACDTCPLWEKNTSSVHKWRKRLFSVNHALMLPFVSYRLRSGKWDWKKKKRLFPKFLFSFSISIKHSLVIPARRRAGGIVKHSLWLWSLAEFEQCDLSCNV